MREAACIGNHEAISYKKLEGAQLDSQDANGITALHMACGNNQYESARVLLFYKVNTNIQDRNNNTPLHYACDSGSVCCAKLLVEAGCDTG